MVPSHSSLRHAGAACANSCGESTLHRRDFLLASGATCVIVSIPGIALAAQAVVAEYPRRRIAKIDDLRTGNPVSFRYPWDHVNCESVLLQLEQTAAGGVGPGRDIVAFNSLCSHMGEIIPADRFGAATGVAGPCPWHWTTFDLTRHGMVVSGHATQSLPQVLLECAGQEIFATGILGLMYGFNDNRLVPRDERGNQ